MNTSSLRHTLFGIAFALALAFTATAQEITGFKAIAVKGPCVAMQNGKPTPIQVGDRFNFGTAVATDRGAILDMEFSGGNTFRLLPNTRLVITQDATNPRLKRLRLEGGQVELSLDSFPKGHKLEVETPTAVCGAVGTRFTVTFEATEEAGAATAASRQSSFSCDQGEVFVASRFTIDDETVEGATMKVPSLTAGSQMVATVHEGLENSYTDVIVNRGRLTFQYGGGEGSRFVATPQADGQPTRFVCALEKSEDRVNMTAVEVQEGSLINNRQKRFLGLFPAGAEITAIGSDDGAVVVRNRKVYREEPAEEAAEATLASQYIAAAKTEGVLHSQWVDATREGRAAPELEQRVRAAAKEATALRHKLTALRTVRLLKEVNRASMRSVRPSPRR